MTILLQLLLFCLLFTLMVRFAAVGGGIRTTAEHPNVNVRRF